MFIFEVLEKLATGGLYIFSFNIGFEGLGGF